jgi:hypothetical protein
MRSLLKLVPLTLLAAAYAVTQDSITFDRNWKVGEGDAQRIGMAMTLPIGDVVVTMVATQKAVKVHENGDADVETSLADMVVLLNGNKVDVPGAGTNPRTVTRVNRVGMPLERPQGAGRGMGLEFIAFASVVVDKKLKPGESATIDYTSSTDSKVRVKGVTTAESIEAGIAKVIGKYQVWADPADEKPMQVAMTHWVRVSDSKFMKSEGTFTDVPSQQGIAISAVQYTMELIEK